MKHAHSESCSCHIIEDTIASNFPSQDRPENVIGLHVRPKPEEEELELGDMFEPTPVPYREYFGDDDKLVESVLKEFSIDQWSNHISSFTKKHRGIRKEVRGDEKRIAKIARYNLSTNTITFKTVPTFFVPNKGYDNKKNVWKEYRQYEVQIQFTNIKEYLNKASARAGRKINLWNISETTFRKLLRASNIKVNCNCGSFNFQGKRYRATQVDSSIYPQNIPDPVWRQYHGSSDYLCKHLGAIIPVLLKSSGKILRMIKDKKLKGKKPAPMKKRK